MQVTIAIQNLSLVLNTVIHVKLESGLKRIQAQYIFIVQNTKAMTAVLMLMLMDVIIIMEMEASVLVAEILYIMALSLK